MKTTICLAILMLLFSVSARPASASPDLGSSPNAAQPLNAGLNIGILAPGEDLWYTFESADLSESPVHTVVLNMIYRPGDHEVAAYVNFQVLTDEQVDRWLRGYVDQPTGIGTFTTTDFDQETAERLWSGAVLESNTYYVRLFNNSQRAVEYHLTALGQPEVKPTGTTNPVQPALVAFTSGFRESGLAPDATLEETAWRLAAAAVQGMSTEDGAAWLMMASQLGWLPTAGGTPSETYSTAPYFSSLERARTVELPEASRAAESAASPLDLYPNVYPTAPLALHDGVNVGRLAAGGEHWYSFIHEDRDAEWFDFMPLTLFSTPTDGNSSHHINFQIFTGSQLPIWSRGTPEDMVPLGEGQWVSRDRDPVTGERLWAGHVVDGDLYYVRVFNHTDRVIDYYLITNDVINTELGNRVWAANRTYAQTLWQPAFFTRSLPKH